MMKGNHIGIGVSGGIAAYKIAGLVSTLVQEGATVDVLMTDAAKKFVTPLTFSSLTARPVFDDQWSQINGHEPQHIKIAQSLSMLLIAPCTMDMLAKLNNGRTNDAVSLVASAIDHETTPVILAPSMNAVMLKQPATQRNIAMLKDDGFTVLDSEYGWQACRAVGEGRMPEQEALLETIKQTLSRKNSISY